MPIRIVYQTLEDRNTDLQALAENGPYICCWENTWLGDGYYFWEAFIQNAHWWGKEARKYNRYIICKAECNLDSELCFDLHGNTDHLQEFGAATHLMNAKGLYADNTTVKRVIDFMRSINIFDFEAVRASGTSVRKSDSEYSTRLTFEIGKWSSLEINPLIQICFFAKDSLNLHGYEIVYPEEYAPGYLA